MAEITNLNTRLQNNKFAPLILPIIAHFNDPHTRPNNPWSALFVAGLLTQRSLNWGDGPYYDINPYRICTCGTPPSATAQWVHREKPCPACDESVTKATSSNVTTSTLEELIIRGALDAGFNNPLVPEIKAFQQLLGGISMHESNDYVFFQQMIDVFYENVSFMNYFLYEFENGTKPELYMNLLGGDFREGFKTAGLLVETITDGEAGVATKAKTTISPNATGFTEGLLIPGPYIDFFVSPTDRRVIWFGISTSYLQPTVTPIGGEVITYHKVALSGGMSVDASRLATKNAIEGFSIPNIDAPYIDATEVIIELTATGPAPGPTGGSDFSTFTGFNAGWIWSFADGMPATGIQEVTSIDYRRATVNGLIGTWFKMYNANDDGVLFYYETPNQPVNPDVLGVAYTTAVAINISANGSGGCYQAVGGISFVCPPKSVCIDGECIYNAAGIEAITTDAIIGNGFEITAVPTYPCVDDCGKGYVSNKPCPDSFPCDGPREPVPMAYAAATDGDYPNSTGGTASLGTASQMNDVIAPDGTVFATDIVDDLQYAKIWNANVPAHMAAKGIKTHYLKPITIFPCICCIQTICPGGCIIIDCPDYDPNYATASLGSVMLQTNYLAITEDLVFNAPGNAFSVKKAERCPTCFM